MTRKRRTSRPPLSSSPTGNPDFQPSAPGAVKIDLSVGEGSLLHSRVAQSDNEADHNKKTTKTTKTAPLDAHHRPFKVPPWNPIERYRSNKNSLPDYGKPEATAMYKKGFKALEGFMPVNFLNGRPTPKESQSITPKRANDTPPTKPTKRQRTENNVNHNLHSVPSSSEVADRLPSAGSSYKKGPQDGQSLRSSADRRSSGAEVVGKGIGELRSIDRKNGLGPKRPRHRTSAGRPSFGSVDSSPGRRPKTTPSNAYLKPKPSLHQLRENRSDPIQDEDDEDVILLEETLSTGNPGTNRRASPRTYARTTKTFAVPDVTYHSNSNSNSEDELSTPQLTVPQPPPTEQNQSIPEEQAKSGRKRAVEHDQDERPMHLTKRRPGNSSRADMHKTGFSSQAMQTQGDYKTLHVIRAVCEPTYVYPAEGVMHENMPGASNKPCILTPVTDGPSRFEAVDEKTGEVLPELEWLTPSIAKVQQIRSNPNSGVVQIIKPKDFTVRFGAGTVLYLEFKTCFQAKHFIQLCCEANNQIGNGTLGIMELSDLMHNKDRAIMQNNMRKHPPPSTTEGADDIQILLRKANRKMATTLPQLQDQQSRSTARLKPVREQMKDNSTLGGDGTEPRTNLTQTLTPTQEKHLHEVVDDENDTSHDQNSHNNAEIESRTSSCVNGHEHEPRSQRNLRSTRPKARSPSPVLERWTKKHPEWADGWGIDLVYERTTVGKGDVERLDEGQLLNDEIISFYLRYLHKQLERKDKQLANKVYVFNSFFWDKLKPKRGEINYDGVKNWTAKIDLLSFDYIIVPINENAHWYLAIICNATGLLQKDEPKAETEGAVPEEDHGQAGGGAESMADKSVTKIAVDVSHISIDDESVDSVTNHQREDDKSSAAKNPKPSKKGHGPRKYDPRAPKVITLDSLGGPHSSVVTALKKYLEMEIKHKKGLEVKVPTPFGTTAKDIPCQPNFTDCGVYLLGYMQEFMKNPDRFTRRILQLEERDWDVDAPTLRNEIRDLILRLQKEYQDGEEHTRRQRALAKKQLFKPQIPPGTLALKPPSPIASEEPAGQSSAPTPASTIHAREETSLQVKSAHVPDANGKATSIQRDIPSSPPPASGDDREGSSSRSQSSGPDTAGNLVDASMIVNLDESIERKHGESVSKLRATPQQPLKSIEDDDQKQIPAPSSRSPRSRKTPHSSDAKTLIPAPGVYETRLLAPIPSSPTSSDTVTKKGSTSRGSASPGRPLGNKSNVESPYFRNATPGVGSIRKKGPVKGRITKVEGIPSSDTEGDWSKSGTKKSNMTIDLTSE